MMILYSFLFCGLLCLIAQIILDNTKMSPGHVTSIFVVVGAFLDIFSIYDKIILKVGAGALLPITSFGHLLSHGAMSMKDSGMIGLLSGTFNLTSAGISLALVLGFLAAIFFKPRH